MLNKIIVATKNQGKLRELKAIFAPNGIELVSLLDYPDIPDIIEDGMSFAENAIIKAKAVYQHLSLPVIADDSGLAADQLNGRPGIHSARYAGEDASDEDNNAKLLTELSKFPEPHYAKYVCCAVYYDGKRRVTESGELKGRIIKEPRGTNGFGYDPYFIADNYNITMAELDMEEKNKISHRGKAFRKLYGSLYGML